MEAGEARAERENTNYPWRPDGLNAVLVHPFTRCTTPAEVGAQLERSQ